MLDLGPQGLSPQEANTIVGPLQAAESKHAGIQKTSSLVLDEVKLLGVQVPENFETDGHFQYLLGRAFTRETRGELQTRKNVADKTVNLARQGIVKTLEVRVADMELREQLTKDLEQDVRQAAGEAMVENITGMRQRVAKTAVSQAIELFELYLRAGRDKLTGLFNRRALEDHFLTVKKYIETRNARAKEADTKELGEVLGVVVLLDIDHFKQFNGTYGHVGGDEVLRKMGISMEDNTRLGDFSARYGGEEFAVLMMIPKKELVAIAAERGQPEEQVVGSVVERLRQNVGEGLQDVAMPDGRRVGVTVSLGATILEPGESFSGVFNRASLILTQAKDAGRDRSRFMNKKDFEELEKPKLEARIDIG